MALTDRDISQLADACQAGAATRYRRLDPRTQYQARQLPHQQLAPRHRGRLEGAPVTQSRIRKHRLCSASRRQEPLRLDARDPDIVKAQER